MTQPPSSSHIKYIVSEKNKYLGRFFLLAPFVGLFIVFIFQSLVFIIFHLSGWAAQFPALFGTLMSLMGFLFMSVFFSLFIGIPLGILYLLRKDPIDMNTYNVTAERQAAKHIVRTIGKKYLHLLLTVLSAVPLIGLLFSRFKSKR